MQKNHNVFYFLEGWHNKFCNLLHRFSHILMLGMVMNEIEGYRKSNFSLLLRYKFSLVIIILQQLPIKFSKCDESYNWIYKW